MNSFLYWSPRVISLMFVAYISMFALDVFGEYTGWELAVALFMHLIPSLVLLIAVVVAWKYEVVGMIMFAGFAIWYLWAAGLEHWYWWPGIAGPSLLVAVLFFLNWRKKQTLEKTS